MKEEGLPGLARRPSFVVIELDVRFTFTMHTSVFAIFGLILAMAASAQIAPSQVTPAPIAAPSVRAIRHEQRLELKAFDQAQKAQRAEFESRERKERHAFFAAHPKGEERRQYIQEFLSRRKQFNADLKQKRDAKLEENRKRLKP